VDISDIIENDSLLIVPVDNQDSISVDLDGNVIESSLSLLSSSSSDLLSFSHLFMRSSSLEAFAVMGSQSDSNIFVSGGGGGVRHLPIAIKNFEALIRIFGAAVSTILLRNIAGRRLSLLLECTSSLKSRSVSSLANEWSVISGLPPHKNVLSAFSFLSGVSLPTELLEALDTTKNDIWDVLITESHVPFSRSSVSKYVPFPKAFSIASDLVRAVAHAQRAGIVHNSVRPSSLVFATTTTMSDSSRDIKSVGRLLLSSWHCSLMPTYQVELIHNNKDGNFCLPSSQYRAPELISASLHNPSLIALNKSDVYSIGITLFELFTGGDIPHGNVLDAELEKLVFDVFPSDYPADFLTLLAAMMRKDATQRISTSAVAKRLSSLGSGRPLPIFPAFVSSAHAAPNSINGMPCLVSIHNTDRDASNQSMESKNDIVDVRMSGDGDVTSSIGETSIFVAVSRNLPLKSSTTSISAQNVALVPFFVNDNDTASVIANRAAEFLDVSWVRSKFLSLLCKSGVIDPQAPIHLLPLTIRSSLLHVTSTSIPSSIPFVTVAGYGLASPPNAAYEDIVLDQRSDVRGGSQKNGDLLNLTAASRAGFNSNAGMSSSIGISTPTNAKSSSTSSSSSSSSSSSEFADINSLCRFDKSNRSHNIIIEGNETTASNKAIWGSVLLSRDEVSSISGRLTKFSYAVEVTHVDSGAGIVIGFTDPRLFDPKTHMFSLSPGSFGYSRTGQICTADGDEKWYDYGESFGVGDIITAEITGMDTIPVVRFYKNGVPQGVALKSNGIRNLKPGSPQDGEFKLRPCVALGSKNGFTLARVTLRNPEAREFDRHRAHNRIEFSEDCTTVRNNAKWATALASHPGVRVGRLQWSVRLDETKHGAGVAVGVVDARYFTPQNQNLGASAHSFCFSKTGKKGSGMGKEFQEYGKSFTNGDTITMTLDMDKLELSFAINGDDQGIAYSGEPLAGCTLVPAVCLGSGDGNKLAKVSIVSTHPVPRHFDKWSCSEKITLVDGNTAAETSQKWGTVFLEHPGICSGRYSFAVHITSAEPLCGAGIGFADVEAFKPESKNLGASANSWCYSKTGKFSACCSSSSEMNASPVSKFETYGAPFKTNDVITAEVNMETQMMRFFVNGRDQGSKKVDGLKRMDGSNITLVPAVVLGSTAGGNYTKVTLATPAVTHFDPRRMNKHIDLKDDFRTAQTEKKWCTVLADHPGVVGSGILRFAVQLTGESGAAVGFVEGSVFKHYAQNLGAAPFTWAVSKTGKISCGDQEGFHPFSDKIEQGSIVGAEVDLNKGIIRFWKNGMLLGTAFQGLAGRGLWLIPAVCLGSNTGGSGKVSVSELREFDISWLEAGGSSSSPKNSINSVASPKKFA
jgi:serine/threonine protein kinase